MPGKIKAGAAAVDISPKTSQFLYGYPHVERFSTGIHDPLISSALYLDDGQTKTIFIANDIIYITKEMAERTRNAIEKETSVPVENIMITATHTHSGPIVDKTVSNINDPVLPNPDPEYLDLLADGIISAARQAVANAKDAKLGLSIADDTGVGTNRRDPSGPADHNVPVLMVKSADGNENIACMIVCSMHPTVLHEDSKLVSADFPGPAREYLQENLLGPDCPVLHHTGPSGNQSPRHVTKANTFEEAERLGHILGKAVEKAIGTIEYTDSTEINVKREFCPMVRREFPSVEQAQKKLDKAIARLEHLRETNAPRQETRTAECDWFGAEETVTLAKLAESGEIENAYNQVLPGEIQVISIGQWNFAGWQGECFVDYALAVKEKAENTFVISLANGVFHGYIVTKEAHEEGGYEASNSLFSYESGQMMIDYTLELLNKSRD